MYKPIYIITIIIIVVFTAAYFFYGKYEKIRKEKKYPMTASQKDVNVEENITALENTNDHSIGGDANRSYKENVFTISIRAYELPDLAKEQFYAGWLIDESSLDNANTVYLGPMKKEESGEFKDDFVLGYKATEDLRSYKKLSITKETIDDQKPEKEIMTGFFGK